MNRHIKPPMGARYDPLHPAVRNIIIWYPFWEGHGSPFDISPYGFNGVRSGAGGLPEWGVGNDGFNLTFDAVDDELHTTQSALLSISGDCTFMCRVNATAVDEGVLIAMEQLVGETLSSNTMFWVDLEAGGDLRYIHEYDAGLNEQGTWDCNLSANTDYHIAVVRDDTAKTVKLYIDGEDFGTDISYTNSADNGGNGLHANFGARLDTTLLFAGSISEIRLYKDRAMTAEEVKQYLYVDPWAPFRKSVARRVPKPAAPSVNQAAYYYYQHLLGA